MKHTSLFIVAATLFGHSMACGQPGSANSISFQGALTSSGGQPISNGNYNITFKFYDGPASPVALGTSNVPNIPVNAGIASAAIPVDGAWFDGHTRYLGISIGDGSELSPRIIITAVPYALKASRLTAPSPFDSTSHVSQQQGLELRWYENTPFIDFTMAPHDDRDYDYRIYCASPEDPRLVFKSEIAPNAIVIRRNGFVGIGEPIPGSELDVNGTATMRVCRITSDRNAKTGFKPVDSRDVLNKVVALPITSWSYTNHPDIRHIGPVAQDFHGAFAVGEDEKHIATVDADGVALAAIQGLNQKLEEQTREKAVTIAELRHQLADMQATQTQLQTRLSLVEAALTLNAKADSERGAGLKTSGGSLQVLVGNQ